MRTAEVSGNGFHLQAREGCSEARPNGRGASVCRRERRNRSLERLRGAMGDSYSGASPLNSLKASRVAEGDR